MVYNIAISQFDTEHLSGWRWISLTAAAVIKSKTEVPQVQYEFSVGSSIIVHLDRIIIHIGRYRVQRSEKIMKEPSLIN